MISKSIVIDHLKCLENELHRILPFLHWMKFSIPMPTTVIWAKLLQSSWESCDINLFNSYFRGKQNLRIKDSPSSSYENYWDWWGYYLVQMLILQVQAQNFPSLDIIEQKTEIEYIIWFNKQFYHTTWKLFVRIWIVVRIGNSPFKTKKSK